MTLAHLLESIFKWLLLGSVLAMLITYFYKDTLPPPTFYDLDKLAEPLQSPTTVKSFTSHVNGQQYIIDPKFDYELNGVIVSYHDADSFIDITHHDQWKDFINLRDLCVIWGDNVDSGVYLNMDFSNDSWTCWAYWPDRATGKRFNMTQLSNNHLLIDDPKIKQILMSAEPGDHIRLKGVLAAYRNPANQFKRGTSTTRTDTGNGACETIYVNEFKIINKANTGIRSLYYFMKWLAIVSLIGFTVMFFIAPVRTKSSRFQGWR